MDLNQTSDVTPKVADIKVSDGAAMAAAGASMTSSDSNLAFQAMKQAGNTANGLHDLQIDFGDSKTSAPAPAAPEARGSETAAASQTDSGAVSKDVDIYSKLETHDPKEAAAVAENYMTTVFKGMPAEQMAQLKDQFNQAAGDTDAQEGVLSILAPASPEVMKAFGDYLNKDSAQPAAEKELAAPSDSAPASKDVDIYANIDTHDPVQAAAVADTYMSTVFAGMPKEMMTQLKDQFNQANGDLNAQEGVLSILAPASPEVMKAFGDYLNKDSK